MLERFSERARRVVVLATEEARRRRHDTVGPEHLLMGILRDGEGMAVSMLGQFGVSLGALQAAADRTLNAMPSVAARGDVQLSSELKGVLEAALEIDNQYCRRYVGTEHLLGALLADERSAAFGILCAAGVDRERTRWLIDIGRAMFRRPTAESVRLIATSKWRVQI